MDLHANVTVNSDQDNDGTDGSITFTSTVNGARALTLDADGGAVTVGGAVGGTTALASLTVTGGAVSLKSVKTMGAIEVTGTAITLDGAYRSDDGAITFTGPVTLAGAVTVNSDQDNDGNDGSITFTSTVNGAHALTLDAHTGSVELRAAVGATTALASLTVVGGQIDLNTVATAGAIDIEGTNIDLNGATYRSDDGNITFTGPVDLHANVTVNSDQDNDGTDGSITFTSTVNGARALTLDADGGAVTVGGAVGGTTALASLTVTAGAVSLKSVKTMGAIAVTGTAITLDGAYRSDDGAITFTGPVTLAGAVKVNSDENDDATDGAITFTSTVDGAHALTLDAHTGSVTVGGAMGGTTALASLTVEGGTVSLNGVTTGTIELRGSDIMLAGPYRSTEGDITFTGPVTLAGVVT